MATVQYQQLDIFIPEGMKSAPVRELPPGSGHTTTAIINRADLVIVSGDPATLARAATNASTGIAGYAVAGELSAFKGGTSPYEGQLFGAGQGSALIPQNPGYVTLNPLGVGPGGGLMLQINVINTAGYQSGGSSQVDVGSTGGIVLDATTQLYIFDPGQSNKILTLYKKVQGVTVTNNGITTGVGNVGDTGARFIAYINVATALA